MKLIGLISTAVLSLTLGAAIPVYAQEQHDQQEEKKDQPAEQKDKKPQPDKPVKQEEKTALKDAYDLLITIYEQKGPAAKEKVDAYTTKFNNVDKDH